MAREEELESIHRELVQQTDQALEEEWIYTEQFKKGTSEGSKSTSRKN